MQDLRRLGLGPDPRWRAADNTGGRLCPSYPTRVAVLSSLPDEALLGTFETPKWAHVRFGLWVGVGAQLLRRYMDYMYLNARPGQAECRRPLPRAGMGPPRPAWGSLQVCSGFYSSWHHTFTLTLTLLCVV